VTAHPQVLADRASALPLSFRAAAPAPPANIMRGSAMNELGNVTTAISWDDFTKVELRVGRIVRAEPFPEAKKPAYKLLVDFGPEIGQRKSSAQITRLYRPETLVGRLVVAVINFPPKQIGPFMSECLVTGFHNENGEIALCVPDQSVPLGAKLL
jgi:tRNA-binding protein